jgi:hypothetical protein
MDSPMERRYVDVRNAVGTAPETHPALTFLLIFRQNLDTEVPVIGGQRSKPPKKEESKDKPRDRLLHGAITTI